MAPGSLLNHPRSGSVALPEAEPGIIGIHFIVLEVGGFPVGGLERSFVREREDLLQHFDFGDDLFGIHTHLLITGVQAGPPAMNALRFSHRHAER